MQALRFAFITQPRLCINSGCSGSMNFCGSVLQRRGGWQGGASLKGQRAPGPSGSFRFLAEFAIEEGQKSFILAILSSTAAGLPCSFYLASTSGCKEKGPTRHGTGFASGVTWGFFPFCQVRCRSPHKPAPQGRGDCSLRSQTPLAAAPRWGLPARHLCLSTKCPSLWRFSRLCCCGVIVCVPRREWLVPINIYPSIGKPGGIPTISP